MNPLSWKCQGLGNPQSIKALHDLVRRWDPKVVFLMETKSKTRRMERIKNRIGMANDLIVPCIGRSGGLALLWAREVDLEIKSFSKNHINATITKPSNNFKWRLTGFYGHSETHRSGGKLGGAPRPQQQMDGFRKVLDYCGFQDLGYIGFDFTWCNMQEGENRKYLRLDRAFVTPEWIGNFGVRKYSI